MENPSFIFSSGSIELKEEGENFYVEGYISTSDLDLVNDIVTKACLMDMADQMRERTIKLDIEHESFRGKSQVEAEINKTIIPAAKIEDFLIDKKGLKIKAMLNKHIGRFQEVKNSIRDGFLDAFSIAFVPVRETIQEKGGQKIRMLDKINLLNVAFTGNPVNTGATIENVFMKSLNYLEEEKAKKPKKPKPQPDPHKEPEDEEEEEKGCDKKPKKKPKSNSNSKEDDTIKLQEVKNMTEDNKETEEKVEESAEAETGKEEAETKEEEKVEDAEEKKEESAPEENAEVKSLGETVAALKDEVADLKAKIKLPVRKSIQSTEDKSADFEDKSLNPLDLIA